MPRNKSYEDIERQLERISKNADYLLRNAGKISGSTAYYDRNSTPGLHPGWRVVNRASQMSHDYQVSVYDRLKKAREIEARYYNNMAKVAGGFGTPGLRTRKFSQSEYTTGAADAAPAAAKGSTAG